MEQTGQRMFTGALTELAAFAVLLERLERQPRKATAEQYRDVVCRMSGMLAEAEPGAPLDALLAAAPATAELYENLQYAHAGLCRSPLDAAMSAEQVAVTAIARARRRD
jgi:hypothetical protein